MRFGDRLPLRNQRLGELIADRLRTLILAGDLADGDLLPKEEDLRAQFPVSKPSLREAMRILETEGLITVRRGNMGGAVVHRPTAAHVAYTLGLVLTAKRVPVGDVAKALQLVEPVCAVLCAERRDRRRTVLPALRRLQREALREVDDLYRVTNLSRAFHEALVEHCKNDTLKVMVGALEALWSTHEATWAARSHGLAVPVDERRAVLAEHQEVIDLIDAGDADAVRLAVVEHLERAQQYPGTDNSQPTVDLDTFRHRLQAP
ncbi:MAG: Transcriptional regulator, GntR family [Acidimicrobiales bacterium]|jgi:GntR family transcriptional repressor for pyruvate dehydrogenase complex|nr:Transcriptional regulator, GntR family [Acidimicrobiales bacterium]